MIVCVCHAVPESTVIDAARAGLSAAEVALRTRAGTSCGCCRGTLESLVAEAHECQGGGACATCPRRAAGNAPQAGPMERSAA